MTHKIKNTGLIVQNTTVPVMVKPLADPGPCRPASDPTIQNGGLFIQFSYDKNANLSNKIQRKNIVKYRIRISNTGLQLFFSLSLYKIVLTIFLVDFDLLRCLRPNSVAGGELPAHQCPTGENNRSQMSNR